MRITTAWLLGILARWMEAAHLDLLSHAHCKPNARNNVRLQQDEKFEVQWGTLPGEADSCIACWLSPWRTISGSVNPCPTPTFFSVRGSKPRGLLKCKVPCSSATCWSSHTVSWSPWWGHLLSFTKGTICRAPLLGDLAALSGAITFPQSTYIDSWWQFVLEANLGGGGAA